VTLDGIDLAKLGEVVISHATCTAHTERSEMPCADTSKFQFKMVMQPDGSRLGVYVARSIRVEPNAKLRLTGPMYGSFGGKGSAAGMPNGENGQVTGDRNAGAGGGGAGRIRINTMAGMATLTGKVSPATTTPCATQGTLAPL
jgi:hypothetical protein